MKRNIVFTLFLCAITILITSCSEDDTQPNPTAGLIKIADGYALGAGAKIELWAEEELFAGYNKVFFTLYDSATGSPISESHIHLHPMMDMGAMQHGCPVEEPGSISEAQLFPAAIVFTMPSGDMGSWSIDV